jgi:uncharacterized protein HemX
MDSQTIAIIGLVLGLIGAIVGSFAYLMGEIRKVGATARRELENNRDHLTNRIDTMAKNEAQERQVLRTEYLSAAARIETDLKKLAENVVRRSDMESLEGRLSRGSERLEVKFDGLLARFSGGAFPRQPGE